MFNDHFNWLILFLFCFSFACLINPNYVFPAIAQLELEKRRSDAFRTHEYEAVFKKAKTTVPELRKSERSMKHMKIISEFCDPHRSLFNDLLEKLLPLFRERNQDFPFFDHIY